LALGYHRETADIDGLHQQIPALLASLGKAIDAYVAEVQQVGHIDTHSENAGRAVLDAAVLGFGQTLGLLCRAIDARFPVQEYGPPPVTMKRTRADGGEEVQDFSTEQDLSDYLAQGWEEAPAAPEEAPA
jgi:hypothetical protein